MTTQRFDYTDFSRLRIERALTLDILREDEYSITARDDFSHLKVDKVGDTLVVGQRGFHWMAPFHPRPHVVITLPNLYELNMSGACMAKVIGFQSDKDFSLKVSGACHLELTRMTAWSLYSNISGASNITGNININGDVMFEVSGASRVMVSGAAGSAALELSGASQARLGNFSLGKAKVNISGASSAQIKVKDSLDINLSGASRLEYSGSPALGRVQVAGASTLMQR
jgi:hypothetical protein